MIKKGIIMEIHDQKAIVMSTKGQSMKLMPLHPWKSAMKYSMVMIQS